METGSCCDYGETERFRQGLGSVPNFVDAGVEKMENGYEAPVKERVKLWNE